MDLGLEAAGMECRWQVEIDEYATRVLERHWPDVPRHRNVQHVGRHNLEPVDVIAGGFPCQDLSVAGPRAGLFADRSGLWWEFLRVVCELPPRFVLVENVPGLIAGDNADAFLGSLAATGFDAEWESIRACDVGAPHLRERVFVVATPRPLPDAERFDLWLQWERRRKQHPLARAAESGNDGSDGHVADSDDSDGRAVSPPCAPCREHLLRQVGQQGSGGLGRGGSEADVADADGGRLAEHGELEGEPRREPDRRGPGRRGDGATDPNAEGERERPRLRTDEQRRIGRGRPGYVGCEVIHRHGSWPAEPDLPRMAHGVADRAHRLRGTGNAVVPQVVEWIGRRMMEEVAPAVPLSHREESPRGAFRGVTFAIRDPSLGTAGRRGVGRTAGLDGDGDGDGR